MEDKKIYLRLNQEQLEILITSLFIIKNSKEYEIKEDLKDTCDDLLKQLNAIHYRNYEI